MGLTRHKRTKTLIVHMLNIKCYFSSCLVPADLVVIFKNASLIFPRCVSAAYIGSLPNKKQVPWQSIWRASEFVHHERWKKCDPVLCMVWVSAYDVSVRSDFELPEFNFLHPLGEGNSDISLSLNGQYWEWKFRISSTWLSHLYVTVSVPVNCVTSNSYR